MRTFFIALVFATVGCLLTFSREALAADENDIADGGVSMAVPVEAAAPVDAAGSAPSDAGPQAVAPEGADAGAPMPDAGEPTRGFPFTYELQTHVRLEFDGRTSFGPGVAAYQRADGTPLGVGLDIRRLRAIFAGSFAERFYFNLTAEIGLSNTAGPGQTAVFRGGDAFAWIDYKHSDALVLRFGQTPLPITFEGSRTQSSQDFLETGMLASTVLPSFADLGLTAFGRVGCLTYALGYFNGEGRNRSPVDRLGDLQGRLACQSDERESNRIKLGVSGRYAFVDPRTQFADAPTAGFRTTNGYGFWNSVYTANNFAPPQTVSVLSSSDQYFGGADLAVDLGRFSLQGEVAYLDYGRREATRSAQDVETTLRAGSLKGVIYYATAGFWLTPPTQELRDMRWVESSFRAGLPRQRQEYFYPSVQLLARLEQMFLSYDSTSRSDPGTERGVIDQDTTRIRVDALQTILSVWITQHVRLSAQYGFYYFPGESLVTDSRHTSNQAVAPGRVIPGERGSRAPPDLPAGVTAVSNPSFFSPAAPNANVLHEITGRVGIFF